MANSNGHAGFTYRSVEHAGECILEEYADGFPKTTASFMIPSIFKTLYPEPIDKNTGAVLPRRTHYTRKMENRYVGVAANARAEEAEYIVFKVFERLVNHKSNPPLLIIRNYKLNQNQLQNFRTSVLTSELGIDFTGLHTRGEFDGFIAVKDLGLLLIEVKTQFTTQQLNKAEDQLQHGKLFFQRIMSHICYQSSELPVVKVIAFPNEQSASPPSKTVMGSHIIHEDIIVNLDPKWEELMSELHESKPNNMFNSFEFGRFMNIITGVWSMESCRTQFYRYNTTDASSTFVMKQNDNMVNRAVLSSDIRPAKDESEVKDPVIDAELARPQDGYPEIVGMNLIYLTPEQKIFYQNISQAILRGPAGSGKTLLFHLKLMDILYNHSIKEILIIAPPPHHLRFEEFLAANGIHSKVYKVFLSTLPSGVVIVPLKRFFDVSPEILHLYDIKNRHILIDDLHCLDLDSYKTIAFDDVTMFIERAYASMQGTDITFWCAVDEGQSRELEVNNKHVLSLFKKR